MTDKHLDVNSLQSLQSYRDNDTVVIIELDRLQTAPGLFWKILNATAFTSIVFWLKANI